MLLIIKKGSAKVLKTELDNKTEGLKITAKVNNTTLHIAGIDPTMDSNEVEKEFKNQVQQVSREEDEEVELCVTSLRPSYSGNLNATITTSRGIAERLVQIGTIKLGWSRCRVRERINISRCYRCLDFGHTANACENAIREKICYNCSKDGHNGKECKSESYCMKCKIDGHRADSTGCLLLFRGLSSGT